MSAAGAVKRAVRGRGGRAKAVEAAQNLSKKKQLTDNIESHLSHTSLSYASDLSGLTSKMGGKPTLSDGTISSAVKHSGATAGVKAPLRVPEVQKLTPEQEELVKSLNRELHIDGKNPSGAGDIAKTTKSSGMDGAQTTQRRVQIHDMIPEKPAKKTEGSVRTSNVPAKEQAPKSGGEYDPTKFLEMAKDKNLGRSERWMLERLGKGRKNAWKVLNKGTDEQIEKELSRWGIEKREGTAAADYMKDIDVILKKKAESGPTLGDKFRSHHGVGLTGLGVVGVSTLDLASSRGQQSNAQLYSDPFA